MIGFNRRFFYKTRMFMAPIFFFIVGIIVTITGAIIASARTSTKGFIKSEAVIEAIEPDGYDAEGTPLYQVYVDYEIDDTLYHHIEYNVYSSSYDVGDSVTIYYNPEEPSEITGPSFIMYVPLGIGVIFIIIGVVSLKKNITKYKVYEKQEQQYIKNNPEFASKMNNVNVFGVLRKTEPIDDWYREDVKRYYFSFDKHFKQGYYMEDENHKIIYEAKMKKLTFFKPFEFEFVNHVILHNSIHKVGHTVSTTVNGYTTSSSVKFDGTNIWELLRNKGIRVETSMPNLTSLNYEVSLSGMPFASISSAGASLHENENKGFMGNISVNGRYRIRTYTEDLDTLFLVLFALARSSEQTVFD